MVKIDQKVHLSKVFSSRERTNILWGIESKTISFLVQRTPSFITSNMLTGIGLLGAVMIFLGFFFAKEQIYFLMLCPLGFAVNWYGDSLDGRLAYYRDIPRKWYGFSLDLIMDWFSTVFIGLGYFVYAPEHGIFAFTIVVLYGWAMLIALLRYKITDQYSIDSGLLGPTETRIILSSFIMVELFFPDTLHYLIGVACALLLIFNIIDTRALLKFGDIRDAEEKKQRDILAQ